MNSLTKLEIRVRGENTASRIANEIFPVLAEFFSEYVGESIRKQSGGLFKKIEDKLKEIESQFPSDPILQMIVRNGLEYSVSYLVKCCETYTEEGRECGEAIYSEKVVYVADLQGGVVSRIYDPPEFRTNHSVDTVIKARKKFKEAEKAFNEARSALFPFGERD